MRPVKPLFGRGWDGWQVKLQLILRSASLGRKKEKNIKCSFPSPNKNPRAIAHRESVSPLVETPSLTLASKRIDRGIVGNNGGKSSCWIPAWCHPPKTLSALHPASRQFETNNFELLARPSGYLNRPSHFALRTVLENLREVSIQSVSTPHCCLYISCQLQSPVANRKSDRSTVFVQY
jgi:hypothetical protein